MSFLDDWKEWSTPKKAISIIAVCCVAVFIIAMIGGSTSPDKNTSGDDVNKLNLVDTADVKLDANSLLIDGKNVATVEEYNDSSAIDDKILSKDDGAIIKQITASGASEVTSMDNPDDVYEFLTNSGMYYTFGKDGKTYIVTINEDNWNGNMLSEMDKFCLENAK